MAAEVYDLTGRVAIITGGGTGIGAATARVLADFGAHTVLASRKMQNLERVAASVEQATGRRSIPVQTDVREEEAVDAMVERTMAEFGRIDILVNNAGGSYMFRLKNTTVDSWDNMVALNLRAPFLCTRAAGPQMMGQGQGVIVNISSSAGVSGVKGGAAYSSAKAGLQMFTRVSAAEWGPKGIRVNCIAVGGVASEGALRAWDRAGFDPEEMAKRNPVRRVGQPDDIAYAVHFLASDAAGFISGETISVDGGPAIGGLVDED